MAFIDMKSELAEAIPGMSRVYAGTLINRAWRVVRDSNLWSFQLGQGGFATPGQTATGTVTVSLGSATVIGDAAATSAWAALPFMFAPTVQQFRVPGFSIYNIIGYEPGQTVGVGNYPFATLTLERPYTDPLAVYGGIGYQMFMAYIPAPVGFKRWLGLADLSNNSGMDIWTDRRTINTLDPARQFSGNPYRVLGLGTDQRPGSATFGQMLYELYPYPTASLSYTTYFVVDGADLVANSDTLPYPITQELVLSKARTYQYEWAEARKDIMAAKGSGANYLTLKKEAEGEFLSRLKTIRLLDKDRVDSYNTNMTAFLAGFGGPYYNSTSNRAGMGLWR